MALNVPQLGFGIGLRSAHYAEVLARSGGAADWMEAISENFMVDGGRPLAVLDHVTARQPVVLHGVSMNLGGSDPLDRAYLGRLRQLVRRTAAPFVSDHLCWNAVDGHQAHDLLPLPYTEEAVAHVAARVAQAQEAVGRQLLLENVSSYVQFAASQLSEWEFLAAVAERADCGILLDVNNVYVSCHNHGWDPQAYLRGIPAARVGQYHLAGHADMGSHLLDTHDRPVANAVWALYADAVRVVGPRTTLIEWDEQVPPLSALLGEAARARQVAATVAAAPQRRAG